MLLLPHSKTRQQPSSRRSSAAPSDEADEGLSASSVASCWQVPGRYAATNWVVGLNGGSSGEGQSATITNVSISAVASPSATNLLYPGGTGDVVVTISNPNPYPVTITAIQLPTNTTYAAGYTTSALTTTQTGVSRRNAERRDLELLDGYERELAHPHDTADRGGQRASEQPAGGHLDQRCIDDSSLTGRVRKYLLLHAIDHRHHGDGWGGATATISPATDAWTS